MHVRSIVAALVVFLSAAAAFASDLVVAGGDLSDAITARLDDPPPASEAKHLKAAQRALTGLDAVDFTGRLKKLGVAAKSLGRSKTKDAAIGDAIVEVIGCLEPYEGNYDFVIDSWLGTALFTNDRTVLAAGRAAAHKLLDAAKALAPTDPAAAIAKAMKGIAKLQKTYFAAIKIAQTYNKGNPIFHVLSGGYWINYSQKTYRLTAVTFDGTAESNGNTVPFKKSLASYFDTESGLPAWLPKQGGAFNYGNALHRAALEALGLPQGSGAGVKMVGTLTIRTTVYGTATIPVDYLF